MPEFFLELFSEEIPARMQKDAATYLGTIVWSALAPLSPLPPEAHNRFYGPRRLAVRLELNKTTEPKILEIRGPRIGAPEQALQGFLRKNNSSKEQLLEEGGFYILRVSVALQSADEIIRERLPDALVKLPWPKSMRWGQGGDFTWVRPLRRITCLLDGEIIPVTLGPITASNETEGHRVLATGSFNVSSVEDWKEKLRANYVVADQDERRRFIADGLTAKATELGLSVAEDFGLLDEVTGLVEWPVPLIGKIDEQFMDLPPEVRELSMKVNQKYFALRDAADKPAPYFAFVANLEASDGGAAIIAGNERVLRARLSDARHFWNQDLKTTLHDFRLKLRLITFHAKIGTQFDRAEAIGGLARQIADMLDADGDEAFQAEMAGQLCKADLTTAMVVEFPELQGIMGGYYADKMIGSSRGHTVGSAIKTHYQPKGPSDNVPTGVVPIAVALADKLYTLIKFFEIGEKPTGSGDPFALRRAALGVIRIILENNLRLHLKSLLNGNQSLFDFIIERLRVKLRGEGKRFDVLDAVLAAGDDDDLVRIMLRVNSVSEFLKSDDGRNLLTAYRRAANILKIEDAKDGPHTGDFVYNGKSLSADEERPLLDVLNRIQRGTIDDFREGKFDKAMTEFAQLRAPVDAFFDKVTVNDPEPELRRNRLRLLAQLRDTMHQIADFSKIEG